MGHKINPIAFRLAVTEGWQSRWFSARKYASFLREDVQIRTFLEKQFRKAGVVRVEIDRGADGDASVTVFTTRPGMLIGKGGAGIETLSKRLKRELDLGFKIRLNIEEVRDMNLSAQAIANNIAEQIEKRVAFRRLLKQSVEQAMMAGAKGVRVVVGGRLNGAEIARTEHLSAGTMPLHTLRLNVQFARSTAFTTYGTVGIKVWLSSGMGDGSMQAALPQTQRHAGRMDRGDGGDRRRQ